MRILGIDPGYERLGIAILEKNSLGKEVILYSECFKTDSKLNFSARLVLVGTEIKNIINKYRPEVLSIETLFFNTNQKTAILVAESRGVVIYECENAGLKIFEATPLQIKTAVAGYGRAQKKDIIKMVKLLVAIDERKTSDDEIDAIAAALTGAARLRL